MYIYMNINIGLGVNPLNLYHLHQHPPPDIHTFHICLCIYISGFIWIYMHKGPSIHIKSGVKSLTCAPACARVNP